MKYLLDTCVISELIKPSPSDSVLNWLDNIDEDNLYLSVITLGEIQKGISKLQESSKKTKLQLWLNNDLENRFKGKIISVDQDIAITWGNILSNAEKIGKKLPSIDTLIGATAIVRNMTVVTRNTSDMSGSGAIIFDPFV